MLVKIRSVASVGLETVPVEVEADVAEQGFPGVTIVGLAGKAVEEAKERIRTAIRNSGMDFPPKKITFNLAPADLPKDGGAYDLPMAVGILAASGQIIVQDQVQESVFYGELSLDGSLRATKGVLLVGLHARQTDRKQIFVPVESANEAAVVEGVEVYPVRSLSQLVDHLNGIKLIEKLHNLSVDNLIEEAAIDFDLSEVRGQEQAKRALTIAAAGGHNLLLWGPPGTGKTMLARSMPGILPELNPDEALEVTRIYSVSGMLKPGESLVRKRPFRSPHHGVSGAGMVGGGSNPMPGEVSLSHLGVLFLDEMAEFSRSVLEALRQPMEDGYVGIVRAAAHVTYPASFTLVAAVNPCPCGYLGHPKKPCRCSDKQIDRYRAKMSGPILDRIDLHVKVASVETEKLTRDESENNSLSSSEIRKLVAAARKMQSERFSGQEIYTNSQMKNRHVRKYCRLDPDSQRIMRLAVDRYNLSARAYFRLIKVARTIADLEEEENIKTTHVAEALQYRQVN